MSTYPVHDLLERWKNNNLDAEQAIGQILQHLVVLMEQGENASHRLNTLTGLIDALEEKSAASSPTKRKRRR